MCHSAQGQTEPGQKKTCQGQDVHPEENVSGKHTRRLTQCFVQPVLSERRLSHVDEAAGEASTNRAAIPPRGSGNFNAASPISLGRQRLISGNKVPVSCQRNKVLVRPVLFAACNFARCLYLRSATCLCAASKAGSTAPLAPNGGSGRRRCATSCPFARIPACPNPSHSIYTVARSLSEKSTSITLGFNRVWASADDPARNVVRLKFPKAPASKTRVEMQDPPCLRTRPVKGRWVSPPPGLLQTSLYRSAGSQPRGRRKTLWPCGGRRPRIKRPPAEGWNY
jgi:hypothetical protein